MLYTVFDHTIILLLTISGLFTTCFPELFILAAGCLMMLAAYESFHEDKSRGLAVLKLVLMALYAAFSGAWPGFVIFFFLRPAREYMRALLGIGSYLLYAFARDKNMSLAWCIVNICLFMGAFIFLTLLYRGLERSEKRKAWEDEKLRVSNVRELHEKRLNERLVRQSFLAERNARLMERENISRNIHNSVGHSITAAIMALDAAGVLYDVSPEDARKRMNDANARIRGSLESIRRAVRVLDEDSVGITAGDLKCEMEDTIEKFEMDTGVRVVRNFAQLMDEIKIPHDHAVFLTGALQEMLVNGLRHGLASKFFVGLWGDSAHIRLVVSDNGTSDYDSLNEKSRIENGFGIRKMISYAEKCGGKAEFVNDGGFKGRIELPVADRSEHV